MLRDTNFERSSEAANFKYEPKESDSILDQVEGMEDKYVNEGKDRSETRGTDQAGEGENQIELDFNDALSTDLDNSEKIHSIIAQMRETNEAEADSMFNRYVKAKEEKNGSIEITEIE